MSKVWTVKGETLNELFDAIVAFNKVEARLPDSHYAIEFMSPAMRDALRKLMDELREKDDDPGSN